MNVTPINTDTASMTAERHFRIAAAENALADRIVHD
jgi:hypothetical protein